MQHNVAAAPVPVGRQCQHCGSQQEDKRHIRMSITCSGGVLPSAPAGPLVAGLLMLSGLSAGLGLNSGLLLADADPAPLWLLHVDK